jgi:hypothetical protein
MGMVQTVHDAIGIGTYIGRSLGDITPDKKYLFPAFRHGEMVVPRIAVVKKRLEEKRSIPVYDKENENLHKSNEGSISIFIQPWVSERKMAALWAQYTQPYPLIQIRPCGKQ